MLDRFVGNRYTMTNKWSRQRLVVPGCVFKHTLARNLQTRISFVIEDPSSSPRVPGAVFGETCKATRPRRRVFDLRHTEATMKEIELVGGHKAIVDDADYEKVLNSGYKWYRIHAPEHRTYYVQGHKNRHYMLLHRFLMNCPENLTVDHINHNGLDNRRSNLRLSNSFQQSANRQIPKNNKSGYKGVRWYRTCWRVELQSHGKKVFIGYFHDVKEAARAYNKAAKEIFGEFACLNEV